MKKLYRVKELSELTSISIRGLHHYDELGLLKPSFRNSAGHRFYSEDDVQILQQITMLKFMDFPLDKIKQILKTKFSDPKNFLQAQCKNMNEEAARLLKASKLLEHLLKKTELNDPINWNVIQKVTEVGQLDEHEQAFWHKKFFSHQEKSEFEMILTSRTEDYWTSYGNRWSQLFNEIESNLHTNPESETGMMLAEKWNLLVNEVYGNHRKLSHKLWEGYRTGVIPETQVTFNPLIVDYISRAFIKLKKEYQFYDCVS